MSDTFLPGIDEAAIRLKEVVSDSKVLAPFGEVKRTEIVAKVLGIGKSALYKILSKSQGTYSIFSKIETGLKHPPKASEFGVELDQSELLILYNALKEKLNVVELMQKWGRKNPLKEQDQKTLWLENALHVYRKYNEAITEKNLRAGWDLLHPDYKKQAAKDQKTAFHRWSNGYRYTLESRVIELQVQPQESSERDGVAVGHAVVAFKTRMPDFESLKNIEKLRFDENGVEKLKKHLKDFRSEIKRLGFQEPDFNRITIGLVANRKNDAIRFLLNPHGNNALSMIPFVVSPGAAVIKVECQRSVSGHVRWLISNLTRIDEMRVES